jgi:mRNA-degrading endonuclease toxin of MazEF toxin-antitoxin module
VNLPLYSSAADVAAPNLVGLQHPALASLPTQLVCPLRQGIALTPFREAAAWGGVEYVVVCDLIRPICTLALKRVGELDSEASSRILRTFQMLLAS